MKNELICAILVSFLLISTGLTQGKWKVAVTHAGDDTLGKQLVQKLNGELTKSSNFLLVSQEEAVMTVHVRSLDIGDPRGETSICSVAFAMQLPNRMDASFCDHTVLRFVKPDVDETVSDLLSTILRICKKCIGANGQ